MGQFYRLTYEQLGHLYVFYVTLIIIIVGFIERKIDTNPLMRLSPRRESPGTGMGRHLKSARQGITKRGGGGYASLNN